MDIVASILELAGVAAIVTAAFLVCFVLGLAVLGAALLFVGIALGRVAGK